MHVFCLDEVDVIRYRNDQNFLHGMDWLIVVRDENKINLSLFRK
ncbi:hypothetical protein EV213_106111 [Aureibacillus halotolerans]|uniref:Uncharacterized protein n=1 Tax=Aureibacillus halotolerans TaxID=1508390 RepID=A0A4R6U763_9BACI|nr:hypothetical protein EV213_106111 [Aureibacillus halotolerans]